MTVRILGGEERDVDLVARHEQEDKAKTMTGGRWRL